MKEVNVDINIISGPRMQNDLMHGMDIFEKGKQLGKYNCYTLTFNTEDGTLPEPETMVKVMKEGLEATDQNVIFIAIDSIGGQKVSDPKAYIKPDVNAISDGSSWFLFKDLLVKLGYEVTTDDHMCVTSISL
jgi:hypothetical protein